jgi:hypothetical protein
MQLTLGFLNFPEPPSGPAQASSRPAAWEQLDEAARVAALGVLTRLIARMLADAPTQETGNE